MPARKIKRDESKNYGSEGSKTDFSKTSPFNLKRRNRSGGDSAEDNSVREIGAQCDLDANTHASMSLNKGAESTENDKEFSKRSKSITAQQECVRHVEFLLEATPTKKIT